MGGREGREGGWGDVHKPCRGMKGKEIGKKRTRQDLRDAHAEKIVGFDENVQKTPQRDQNGEGPPRLIEPSG